MTIYFGHAQRFTGDIGFVTHHSDWQAVRQARHKLWPNLCRFGCGGGGTVNHKQHAICLFDLVPCTFDADALHFVTGFTQAGGVDDVQRHAVDVNMLAQYVAGGAGNVGDDRRIAAG